MLFWGSLTYVPTDRTYHTVHNELHLVTFLFVCTRDFPYQFQQCFEYDYKPHIISTWNNAYGGKGGKNAPF